MIAACRATGEDFYVLALDEGKKDAIELFAAVVKCGFDLIAPSRLFELLELELSGCAQLDLLGRHAVVFRLARELLAILLEFFGSGFDGRNGLFDEEFSQ